MVEVREALAPRFGARETLVEILLECKSLRFRRIYDIFGPNITVWEHRAIIDVELRLWKVLNRSQKIQRFDWRRTVPIHVLHVEVR